MREEVGKRGEGKGKRGEGKEERGEMTEEKREEVGKRGERCKSRRVGMVGMEVTKLSKEDIITENTMKFVLIQECQPVDTILQISGKTDI